MITKKQVEKALKKVIDPEIGISILDMGLIKNIKIKDSEVKITMTLTVPFCPLRNYIVEDVKKKVREVENVKKVEVEMV